MIEIIVSAYFSKMHNMQVLRLIMIRMKDLNLITEVPSMFVFTTQDMTETELIFKRKFRAPNHLTNLYGQLPPHTARLTQRPPGISAYGQSLIPPLAAKTSRPGATLVPQQKQLQRSLNNTGMWQ
jgi:hypothetical protein